MDFFPENWKDALASQKVSFASSILVCMYPLADPIIDTACRPAINDSSAQEHTEPP